MTGEEEEEEEAIGPSPPPEDIPEISTVKRVEVEIQERRDTRPGVPHVREWDRGKGKPQWLKTCIHSTFTLLPPPKWLNLPASVEIHK